MSKNKIKTGTFREIYWDVKIPWGRYTIAIICNAVYYLLMALTTSYAAEIVAGNITDYTIVVIWAGIHLTGYVFSMTAIIGTKAGVDLVRSVQSKIWHQVLHLRQKDYDKESPNSLISRITSDAEVVVTPFTLIIGSAALIVVFIFGIASMTNVNTTMARWFAGLYVPVLVYSVYICRFSKKAGFLQADRLAKQTAFLSERFANNAILLMGQLGQGGGMVVTDILIGKINPSGKTVDTWARDCMDYPSSKEFSNINGDFNESRYTEGIYIGHRHFDTFGVEPEYCFGYGLSYTDFDISISSAMACAENMKFNVTVKNTGVTYSGKEVVQIYASAPKGELDKPFQALIGFYKSKLLAPGEVEKREILIPMERMASYSEVDRAWVLEAGNYVIRVGNSSRNTKPVLNIWLENKIIGTKPNDGNGTSGKTDAGALEIAKTLPVEELAQLCVGASRKTSEQSVIGNAAQIVPGAAGEATAILESKGVRSIILADGPAGIRIEKECTAIPIGGSLAQSWNEDAAYDAGAIVGEEMLENDIDLWLAPALNIHRHPLCGRNFEYYSEDPFISGRMAAAVVNGAQKRSRKGVTIKHFAANNQEENRYFINVQVSERTMREIYLKCFEIAVKESTPMAIMTSYNLINGIHTANHKELISIARDEWGFDGIVMTDWFTSQDVPEITDKYKSEYPIGR